MPAMATDSSTQHGGPTASLAALHTAMADAADAVTVAARDGEPGDALAYSEVAARLAEVAMNVHVMAEAGPTHDLIDECVEQVKADHGTAPATLAAIVALADALHRGLPARTEEAP